MNALTYKDCIVGLVTYNNGEDLELTFEKFPDQAPYSVVVHVDGSTDGSDACLEKFSFPVIRTNPNRGVGKAIKNCIEYARENGFKAVAIIPGNNKNHPEEIPDTLRADTEREGRLCARFAVFARYGRRAPSGSYATFPPCDGEGSCTHVQHLTGKRCTDALMASAPTR